jgi:hypothetical protein
MARHQKPVPHASASRPCIVDAMLSSLKKAIDYKKKLLRKIR